MEPFDFKFCLCGDPCPSRKEFNKYCLEIDGQFYFATNKQLIPVTIVKEAKHIRNYTINAKYVVININNIINFFKYVVDKNLFAIFHDFDGMIEIEGKCYLIESTIETSKYLARNNTVNIFKFFLKILNIIILFY
ncbi:hypothetical protein QJ854_gp921 [Moumouvirus goulette]|uniref:Uncharacterized protein n=1 Tax=Moumouvirus goulette TaxID=1247379 RepID=M1PLS0_9VIRU|nr:hypothetical protein QJ854_gp921 [Moumouvirus goulette]AGF84861.1 hypothetical protein glt_00052 [Moumouvirus goulette]